MSIYCTFWTLQFDISDGSAQTSEWVEVWAQGVLGHVGRGEGYEDGDPYSSFLPSHGWLAPSDETFGCRAVVFVLRDEPKGTAGVAGQQYENPLLVLTGLEYRSISFEVLHAQLVDSLRRRLHPAPPPLDPLTPP